jgi:uncharacterized protein (DUF2236 family)
VAPTVDSLFPPDAMVRKVHGEGVLLAGGGRALLLQIAHPAIAAGVAEHSSFQYRRTDRLLRTLRSTLAIVFGSREQALAVVSRINALHRRVAGEGYNARDPELLLWVLSTLIDTSLLVHERFVRRLGPDEAAAYYEDMRRIGLLLGLPAGVMPADLNAHRRYFEEMVASLQVSATALALTRQIFRPNPGLEAPMWLVRQTASALLPPRLRAQFGLDWGTAREATLQALSGLSRGLLPLIPAAVRAPPPFLMPPRDSQRRFSGLRRGIRKTGPRGRGQPTTLASTGVRTGD